MSINRRHLMIGAAASAAVLAVPTLAVAGASPVVETGWRKLLVPHAFGGESHRITEENCYTNVYDLMDLFDRHHGFEAVRIPVDSDFYRQIMRDYPETMGEHGIPPHINFGGAVVSGKGDPTFHSRWVERTKAKLLSGELV